MDLNPENKWECQNCSKMFETNRRLTRHMVTHDPDAKVKCEVCDIIVKNRTTLSSHMWRLHSNRKRPSCGTCHRPFPTFASLRRHTDAIHNAEERPRFPCTFPGCGKTYLHKGGVSQHVKAEHTENPVRFRCTLCGKEFKVRSKLAQHIRTHTTEKPYNCATCGRGLAKIEARKRHQMTHLEKSARDVSKCHICPQTFISWSGLQYHIRFTHENLRDYLCPVCDKRFCHASTLKRHVEEIHNTGKIHFCDKCEYKSYSKANLASHRMRHNAAKYGCYFCGKKFFTFS
ncbi:zinc finger protein 480-like [Folsomia candida]|uniref:zinc finger protein 480-like n=1 Tax=Folsomia candida TaxID=158441 RepID=UPI0016052FCF|nr:zinc finger protein 480-like [Folsomia candida]